MRTELKHCKSDRMNSVCSVGGTSDFRTSADIEKFLKTIRSDFRKILKTNKRQKNLGRTWKNFKIIFRKTSKFRKVFTVFLRFWEKIGVKISNFEVLLWKKWDKIFEGTLMKICEKY